MKPAPNIIRAEFLFHAWHRSFVSRNLEREVGKKGSKVLNQFWFWKYFQSLEQIAYSLVKLVIEHSVNIVNKRLVLQIL